MPYKDSLKQEKICGSQNSSSNAFRATTLLLFPCLIFCKGDLVN